MRTNWKRFFVWSSLGGLAVGTTVALSRRLREASVAGAPGNEKIPEKCRRISLLTGRFSLRRNGRPAEAQDEYRFEATPFKVWSVVDMSPPAGLNRPEGARVFHVDWIRHFYPAEDREGAEETLLLERFYGTLRVADRDGAVSPANSLGRGMLLEIRKCNVGGASNGVETGEVHRSAAIILNYRCEYATTS